MRQSIGGAIALDFASWNPHGEETSSACPSSGSLKLRRLGVPLPLPQIRASILKITFLLVLRLVLVLGAFAFLLVALKLK